MGEEFCVNVAIGFGYHFPRSSYPGPSLVCSQVNFISHDFIVLFE